MIRETHFKSFNNLVKFVTVHHKNIQILTKEVRKIISDIYPLIMKYFLVLVKSKYNLRNFKEMKQQNVRTIWFGIETTLYQALQLHFLEYKVII